MKVIVMTTKEKDSAYKQLNPLVIYYNLTGKRNYLRSAKKNILEIGLNQLTF